MSAPANGESVAGNLCRRFHNHCVKMRSAVAARHLALDLAGRLSQNHVAKADVATPLNSRPRIIGWRTEVYLTLMRFQRQNSHSGSAREPLLLLVLRFWLYGP